MIGGSHINIRTFKKQLRRGLGSAIVELMNAPDKEVYRDAVLWGCVHDIAYDTQVEGTKADY
jgi:hypothetical protein